MKKFGIIGYPLAQSASPAFFNAKFAAEGIDAEYIPFEIESIDELPRIIEENPELCGFNVTIPYKQQVMKYLAGISDEASRINAVNVVKVERDENGKALLYGKSILSLRTKRKRSVASLIFYILHKILDEERKRW